MLITTVNAVVTLTVAVFDSAHCPALGVKVKTIAPFNPEGLKTFPATPLPLQLPAIPLWLVLSAIEEEVLHKEAGGALLMTTAVAVVTLTVAVLGKAHCPAVGVKVSTILPLKPDGLKVFPDTPEPLHVPAIPLWVVLSATDEAVLHKVAGGALFITTATAAVTVIEVVLGKAHCPALGVKVKTILPLSPEGLNELPATPDPLQFPVTPLCVVANATAAAVLHNGPIGVKTVVVGGVIIKLTGNGAEGQAGRIL